MNEDQQLLAQLEAATRRPDAPADPSLDAAAQELRQVWLSFGRLLSAVDDAENVDDAVNTGATSRPRQAMEAVPSPAARARTRPPVHWLSPIACFAALAMSLLLLAGLFTGARPVLRPPSPNRPVPIANDPSAADDGSPAHAESAHTQSGLAWNDQLDRRLAAAGEYVVSFQEPHASQGHWSVSEGQAVSSVLVRLQVLSNEAADESL